MRFHSTDYRKDRERRGVLLNRGFWFWLPRPLATCRILGHRPVVDGTAGLGGRPGARWVCCDRCGVRPEPQGSLDPAAWSRGDAFDLRVPADGVVRAHGAWPEHPEGVFGGQLILGRTSSCGISVKVGNAGSEHTLAGHISLPFPAALYLHTEQFGTWLQRRLVPDGYESRVIEAAVHDKRLWWRLWVLRDSGLRQGWRAGWVRLDPRDIAWGEKRYQYADEGDPAVVSVHLPEGDSYPVTMQLQRRSFGRPEGRQKLSWTVDCDYRPGIPHRDGWKDGLCGWSVPVSDGAARLGMWQQEAAAACVAKITSLRVRYGWKSPAAP